MFGQGSGQDLLPKAYLEKGPRLGHPSVRVPMSKVSSLNASRQTQSWTPQSSRNRRLQRKLGPLSPQILRSAPTSTHLRARPCGTSTVLQSPWQMPGRLCGKSPPHAWPIALLSSRTTRSLSLLSSASQLKMSSRLPPKLGPRAQARMESSSASTAISLTLSPQHCSALSFTCLLAPKPTDPSISAIFSHGS